MKKDALKTPEERLTRGKDNFINCTDYDDAVEAIKEYAIDYHNQIIDNNEMYKKIYIKSKDDLPKEEDVYYVHIRPDNKIVEWVFYEDADYREILKYIDWYFQPISKVLPSEQVKEKSVEELRKLNQSNKLNDIFYIYWNDGKITEMTKEYFENNPMEFIGKGMTFWNNIKDDPDWIYNDGNWKSTLPKEERVNICDSCGGKVGGDCIC